MGLSHRSALVGVATLAMLATATPAMAAEPVGVIREAGGATAVATATSWSSRTAPSARSG